MKEATGELNMTVFVVIAVGILTAFFFTVVWPMMRSSQNRVANCNVAVCDPGTYDNGQVSCVIFKKDNNGRLTNEIKDKIKCPWKG